MTLLRKQFVQNPTKAYSLASRIANQDIVGTVVTCEGSLDVFAFATGDISPFVSFNTLYDDNFELVWYTPNDYSTHTLLTHSLALLTQITLSYLSFHSLWPLQLIILTLTPSITVLPLHKQKQYGTDDALNMIVTELAAAVGALGNDAGTILYHLCDLLSYREVLLLQDIWIQ